MIKGSKKKNDKRRENVTKWLEFLCHTIGWSRSQHCMWSRAIISTYWYGCSIEPSIPPLKFSSNDNPGVQFIKAWLFTQLSSAEQALMNEHISLAFSQCYKMINFLAASTLLSSPNMYWTVPNHCIRMCIHIARHWLSGKHCTRSRWK